MTPDRVALVQEARDRECEFVAAYGASRCSDEDPNPGAWCAACLLAALVETEPAETTAYLELPGVQPLPWTARDVGAGFSSLFDANNIQVGGGFTGEEAALVVAAVNDYAKRIPAPPVTETDR